MHGERACRGSFMHLIQTSSAGVRGNHDNANATVCADNTFAPFFPASCPFVTAVGSTQGLAPEVATHFTADTGGGFSNFFPSPTYQSRAVGKFFCVGVPGAFNGTFNRTGRCSGEIGSLCAHVPGSGGIQV
ncbi:hypothetical protein DFH09DRAFT_1068617 [Mycena vulgaris]|nr:hypothetical protein DFH09DRAFT_1068617 [Mycena vulgaris]